ncbi:hypothetical protein [Simiduia litorea]|uniref:hypothetical protein n=1 Tax=Simiduia litorea TaxID=1435348 RepID=UPI0036F404AD
MILIIFTQARFLTYLRTKFTKQGKTCYIATLVIHTDMTLVYVNSVAHVVRIIIVHLVPLAPALVLLACVFIFCAISGYLTSM